VEIKESNSQYPRDSQKLRLCAGKKGTQMCTSSPFTNNMLAQKRGWGERGVAGRGEESVEIGYDGRTERRRGVSGGEGG